MATYPYKCSCGQPYDVIEEGKCPFKDTFNCKCPSCDKELTYKASCFSIEWEFDKTFSKKEQ